MQPRIAGVTIGDRQPGGEGIGGVSVWSARLGGLDPAFGIAGPRCEAASGRARTHADPHDLGGECGDLARGGAVLGKLEDQVARLRGVGEDDTLPDGAGQHRRIVVGQGLCGLAGDDGARAAAVQHETRGELRTIDARLAQQSISADAQPSSGDGCTGISTTS